MESSGLTPFALFFMLLSMGAVTVLAAYCYWRILREPGSASGAAAAAPPAEERTGDPGPERS